MNQYETIIIAPPNLGEADLEGLVTGVEKELAERFGASNLVVHRWGKKTLAYPIRKYTEGYYVLYEYESDNPDCVSGLESRLRINESVMRFLTIRRDEERQSEARMKERFAKRRKHTDSGEVGESDVYTEDFAEEE